MKPPDAGPRPGRADRVRVYVAEDHPLFLRGVVESAESRRSVELVGCASDGQEALEQVTRLRPDVTILDVKMPHMDGPKVLQELRRRGVDTRVLFLSAMLDRTVVYEAIAAGADGYLSKFSSPDDLWDAVELVARGGTVIPPEIQTELVEHIRDREQARALSRERPRLTTRELEVLTLVAQGCSAPEIGRRLHLSPTTVKTHMKHIYEKLDVSDRASAIAEAMRRGLIE